MMTPWSAVVLAGGRGAGLGGVDKASIEVRGRTLLAWALDAVVDAREVVVVGEAVPTDRPVTFVREDPAYGGPVAGLLTGVDALLHPAAYVAVLAVDMPRVDAHTLRRLTDAARGAAEGPAAGADGAVLIDPDGRRQLALVLRTERLAQVRPGREEQHGHPLHRLLAPLRLVDVPARGDEHRDVDSWADLRDLAE